MADETKPTHHHHHPIQIEVDPTMASGVYSNLMTISHRKEEFILDFLFLQPQQNRAGQSVANLRSRIITSPEHMRRILRAIEENLSRYEASFGPIQAATDIPKVTH